MKEMNNSESIFGNFRDKDFLGVHPKLFSVFQRCLLTTLHLHLSQITPLHDTFPNFTLSDSCYINLLNLCKWSTSDAFKEISKSYLDFLSERRGEDEIYPSAKINPNQ